MRRTQHILTCDRCGVERMIISDLPAMDHTPVSDIKEEEWTIITQEKFDNDEIKHLCFKCAIIYDRFMTGEKFLFSGICHPNMPGRVITEMQLTVKHYMPNAFVSESTLVALAKTVTGTLALLALEQEEE